MEICANNKHVLRCCFGDLLTKFGAGAFKLDPAVDSIFVFHVFDLPLRMSDISDLSAALSRLRLRHQSQLDSLLSQQQQEKALLRRRLSTQTTPPRTVRPACVSPPPPVPIAVPIALHATRSYYDVNGTALSVGDTVEILTNAKSGRIGDRATLVKFTKSLSRVCVKLHRTRTTTQRAPDNLLRIPPSP